MPGCRSPGYVLGRLARFLGLDEPVEDDHAVAELHGNIQTGLAQDLLLYTLGQARLCATLLGHGSLPDRP